MREQLVIIRRPKVTYVWTAQQVLGAMPKEMLALGIKQGKGFVRWERSMRRRGNPRRGRYGADSAE